MHIVPRMRFDLVLRISSSAVESEWYATCIQRSRDLRTGAEINFQIFFGYLVVLLLLLFSVYRADENVEHFILREGCLGK